MTTPGGWDEVVALLLMVGTSMCVLVLFPIVWVAMSTLSVVIMTAMFSTNPSKIGYEDVACAVFFAVFPVAFYLVFGYVFVTKGRLWWGRP